MNLKDLHFQDNINLDSFNSQKKKKKNFRKCEGSLLQQLDKIVYRLLINIHDILLKGQLPDDD